MSKAWDGFYMILRDVAKLPANPEAMSVNYTEPETGATFGLAWVDLRIAIAFENDSFDKKAMEKKGWKVYKMNTASILASEKLLELVYDLAIEKEMQASINKAHMTVSKIENIFLRKLLEAGVPMPDRNHKIYDEETGALISVPDFAWKSINNKIVKVVVEVDGVYWHALKDNDDLLKRFADDAKGKRDHLDEKVKIAHKHDSQKRREIQRRGWKVIPLSTEDMEENMDEIVKDVKKILRDRVSELSSGSDADLVNLFREQG